ncbi:MAG: hypothetical protein ACRC2R_25880 [Xenococcaceae cyanobacterium]
MLPIKIAYRSNQRDRDSLYSFASFCATRVFKDIPAFAARD